MSGFTPGLELNRAFFREVLRPTLAAQWPALRYSAGLLGWGSDVLGFDTPRSTDHMWGPRGLLFLSEPDHARLAPEIVQGLRLALPRAFRGHCVHYGPPDAVGVRRAEASGRGPVEHLVEVVTPESFFRQGLGIDINRRLEPADWLALEEQALLEVTSGEVFYDGLGRLHELRRQFAFYPQDVWLHRLACAWQALTDEEAFPGRCHELNDSLGWRILAASQARKLMHLCFLMERRYAPYSKWFGTAFLTLRTARRLAPILEAALTARSWPACEEALVRACEYVARKHNRLGIAARQSARATLYFGRPYRVIWGDRFAQACRDAIEDETVKERTRVHRH